MTRIIGQYRVTGLLGRGGMGAVYSGEHVLLDRPAAIKVLLPELSQKQEAVARFFTEARAAAAIRNPGIVEIYDFGWSKEGEAYIIMERLEGETLALRQARGRLGWQAGLSIVRQIAGALGAAHAKGIIHRDLKPDNVFLVRDPEVPGGERIKLLDFGIAKLAGDASLGLNVTRTGAVIGTPTYMSPEQCRGVPADHRADLYSLGCIAFELCSGRPPFVGEAAGDVLAAHIHLPVPAVEALASEIPINVAQLIQRLLAKSPADRFQTTDELLHAIDAVTLDGAPPALAASGGPGTLVTQSSLTTLSGAAATAIHQPMPVARRKHFVVAGAAASAALVAALVVVAMRGRVDRAPQDSTTTTSLDTRVVTQHDGRTTDVLSPAPTPPQPVAAPPAIVVSPVHVDARVPAQPPSVARSPSAPVAPSAEPPAAVPPAGLDLVIDSIPAGAQVVLAGAVLGKTPYHGTIPRPQSIATLVIRLAGYADKRVTVDPDHVDQPLTAKLTLVPVRAPKDNPDESVNPF